MKPKVLIADPISERGIQKLKDCSALEVTVKIGLKPEELLPIISEFDALIVRSQTKVTAEIIEAATKLKVIGRAGVGVDNVDIEAATKRGIVVMNTPGGNTISTAEHAFSLLVSIARNIPQAHASIIAGRWDRKKYAGVELYGKTLAILGMGRIGTEVARRAIAFGMQVLAYDPFLSATRARSLQVDLVENLDDILPRADFITLHMPMTPETHHMLDESRLAKTKKGVRIVNCARGGLIDETALHAALANGQVAAAALDVYEVEPPPADFPLRELSNIVFTPHLGASTAEAQESVGIEIAQQIQALLIDGEIRNAVNMPSIDAKTLAVIGPFITLGEKLGLFLSQIAPKRCDRLDINFSGKVNEADTTAITRAVLKGFLSTAGGDEVNVVNAPAFAAGLGIKVSESRTNETGEFTDLIEVSASLNGNEPVSMSGVIFGGKQRIIKINGRYLEANPEGVLLVYENLDQPGVVGIIGSLLGEADVNIAGMSLSRNKAGGRALTVLNLDALPEPSLIEKLRELPAIHSAQIIEL